MTLYAYNNFISDDEDLVIEYIAKVGCYLGEEGLMNIIENEIIRIDTLDELKKWCDEQGEDYEYHKEWFDEIAKIERKYNINE